MNAYTHSKNEVAGAKRTKGHLHGGLKCIKYYQNTGCTKDKFILGNFDKLIVITLTDQSRSDVNKCRKYLKVNIYFHLNKIEAKFEQKEDWLFEHGEGYLKTGLRYVG